MRWLPLAFGALAGSLGACGGGSSATATSNSSNNAAPTSLTVGGTVVGLTGSGLVLRLNGGNDLAVPSNGNFSFTTSFSAGADYVVSVRSQPTGQSAESCDVTNGAGIVSSSSAAGVFVICHGPVGRFLYVANTDTGTISGYSVGATTGALTGLPGSPYTAAGASPSRLVQSPDGKRIFVMGDASPGSAGGRSGSVAGMAIDSATGTLATLAGSPFTLTISGGRLLMHPSGQFLAYVVAGAGSTRTGVYMLRIAADGLLSLVTGSPFATNTFANGATFDPTGNFLYLGTSSPIIACYAVNANTGALTLTSSAPTGASTPVQVVVDTAGSALYALLRSPSGNGTADSLAAFAINPTSGLGAAYSGSPQTTGATSLSIAVTPGGRNVYVVNSGIAQSGQQPTTISGFAADTTNGLLTPLAGSPYAANVLTGGTATIDPTGRYIALQLSGVRTGPAIYAIDNASGALVALPDSPLSIPSGFVPSVVAFDPSGRYTYFAGRPLGSVMVYAINPANNRLTNVENVPTAGIPSDQAPLVVGLQ